MTLQEFLAGSLTAEERAEREAIWQSSSSGGGNVYGYEFGQSHPSYPGSVIVGHRYVNGARDYYIQPMDRSLNPFWFSEGPVTGAEAEGEEGAGDGEGEGGLEQPYPELELPRYETYGGLYPYTEMPTYEPFQMPYPTLQLPRYTAFPEAFPELGALYGQAEDVIGRMLRGEGLSLPVEELMTAYTEEERLAMEKYMPELREYWGEKNLLRSGMEREAEREAVTKAAAGRGTYRAQLEKESVIRTQEGIVTALNMAMEHVGMGYEAQRDAWQAAMGEYTKVYQYEIAADIGEYEADARAWDAALGEYTKVFASNVDATTFGQAIQEKAYSAGVSEYTKVYDSLFRATGDEYGADVQAFEAAWREMDTVRQLEFQKWMYQLQADIQMAIAKMELSSAQKQSIWGAIGTIFGSIIGAMIPG